MVKRTLRALVLPAASVAFAESTWKPSIETSVADTNGLPSSVVSLEPGWLSEMLTVGLTA